jgi:glycosyltransferase involved in cell wall biosynthesis
MNLLHLTDSPFFGGPERQILGLSRALPAGIRSTVVCFGENATCLPFLERLITAGIRARMLESATPRYGRLLREIHSILRQEQVDLLICHGYKADILGLIAARFAGVPVISVSRGWTGHTRKVRLNEALDRRLLRFMDFVVCVSEGQANRVRGSGVPVERVVVIRNAIDLSRFPTADGSYAGIVAGLFPEPVNRVVIAVGRLSPEKGFEVLVAAARKVLAQLPRTGFLLIGDGPSRRELEESVRSAGIADRFVIAGFSSDVDLILPHADVLAQSSHTEGLPNVVLEACAAGVPVVATAVGGTGEVVRDGWNGYLVSAKDDEALASRLAELLGSQATRIEMGQRGREHVQSHFSFAPQSREYQLLFDRVVTSRRATITERATAC